MLRAYSVQQYRFLSLSERSFFSCATIFVGTAVAGPLCLWPHEHRMCSYHAFILHNCTCHNIYTCMNIRRSRTSRLNGRTGAAPFAARACLRTHTSSMAKCLFMTATFRVWKLQSIWMFNSVSLMHGCGAANGTKRRLTLDWFPTSPHWALHEFRWSFSRPNTLLLSAPLDHYAPPRLYHGNGQSARV